MSIRSFGSSVCLFSGQLTNYFNQIKARIQANCILTHPLQSGWRLTFWEEFLWCLLWDWLNSGRSSAFPCRKSGRWDTWRGSRSWWRPRLPSRRELPWKRDKKGSNGILENWFVHWLSLVETFGGWDKEAVKYLKDIARLDARRWAKSDSIEIKHFFQRLSVTLQRGNSSLIINREIDVSPI